MRLDAATALPVPERVLGDRLRPGVDRDVRRGRADAEHGLQLGAGPRAIASPAGASTRSGRRDPPSITRSSTMPSGDATAEERRFPRDAERRQPLRPRGQVAVAIEGPGDVGGTVGEGDDHQSGVLERGEGRAERAVERLDHRRGVTRRHGEDDVIGGDHLAGGRGQLPARRRDGPASAPATRC